MSMLLRQLARHVARKVAENPDLRDKVVNLGRGVAREATRVADKGDPAYAAGRAVRRALDSFGNKNQR